MKGTSHSKSAGVFVTVLAALVYLAPILTESGRAEDWKPAYTDEQLDLINNRLGKWKQAESYTKVKDIFGDRSYVPDWRTVKENAEPWEWMPDSFPNERAARKAGGHCDYLKDMTQKTCLLKYTGMQGAWIFVYDQDPSGKFIKSGVIVPPTWYDLASVTFVDVFGPSRPKFILIEHQGDHGTGVNERIQWLLGWHDGAFRTAFRETVYLDIDGLGEATVYRLNYRIVKGAKPRIETQSSYDLVAVTAKPYDFHSSWHDWLFWNEKDFSFYQREVQEENADFSTSYGNKFKFRQQVEKKRLKTLDLPPVPQRADIDDTLEKWWDKIDGE